MALFGLELDGPLLPNVDDYINPTKDEDCHRIALNAVVSFIVFFLWRVILNLLRASFSCILFYFLVNPRCPERRGYPTQMVLLVVDADIVATAMKFYEDYLAFLQRISKSIPV